jgi:hypothetical protein
VFLIKDFGLCPVGNYLPLRSFNLEGYISYLNLRKISLVDMELNGKGMD